MKKLSLLLLFCISFITLHAQFQLDVAGSTKINGRLDIELNRNIFIGEGAGRDNPNSSFNIAIGQSAGQFITTGTSNIFIGPFAGVRNTTGFENIFIGREAGLSNTIGEQNIFMGYKTGQSNTTGISNIFIGKEAGLSNTEGQDNTFVGVNAGNNNRTAIDNTFIGMNAGPVNTRGSRNTFLGNDSGLNNTLGLQNTFIGGFAGGVNETGNNNTLVGYASHFATFNIENSFALGALTYVPKSNCGVLGNMATQQVRAYVNLSTASDKRMKKNIREDVQGLDFILQLRPVSYQMDLQKADKLLRKNNVAKARQKDIASIKELKAEQTAGQVAYQKALAEKSKIRYTGFIAQEVEKAIEKSRFAFSGLIKPANDNDHYSLRYAEFVVPLVKGMQEQQTIIKQQDQTIKELQREVNELQVLFKQLLSENQENNPTAVDLMLKQTPSLGQNKPNPFLHNTQVDYMIPKEIKTATIQICMANGKVVERLTIPKRGVGTLNINAQAYPSGTYFYSLIIDGQIVATKQMLLAK